MALSFSIWLVWPQRTKRHPGCVRRLLLHRSAGWVQRSPFEFRVQHPRYAHQASSVGRVRFGRISPAPMSGLGVLPAHDDTDDGARARRYFVPSDQRSDDFWRFRVERAAGMGGIRFRSGATHGLKISPLAEGDHLTRGVCGSDAQETNRRVRADLEAIIR
jgi:hypothetical protein